MIKLFPTRLSITDNIDNQLNENTLDEQIALPLELSDDLFLFLEKEKVLNDTMKAILEGKGIVKLRDFLECELGVIVEIFLGSASQISVERFKELINGIKKEVFSIAQKNKKIGISTIVPNPKVKIKVEKVNKAINNLASFTADLLPTAEDVVFFDFDFSLDPKLSFWIQDRFLTLKERWVEGKRYEVLPVDDSIGRIEQIAFSYYSNGKKEMENSYNKIYTDLIIKFAKVFNQMDRIDAQSVLVKERLIFLEDKNSSTVYDHADSIVSQTLVGKMMNQYEMEARIENIDLIIKGGNTLFVGDIALVGYDSVLESIFFRKDLIEKRLKYYEGMDKEESGKLRELFDEEFKIYEDEFIDLFSEKTGVEKDKILFVGSREILAEGLKLPPKVFSSYSSSEKYSWTKYGRYSAQGIYHIDLFITPAGVDSVTGNSRLLVGDPVNTEENHIPSFNYTKEVIEKIVNQLTYQGGFSIYRNPLPLTFIDRYKKTDDGNVTPYRNWFLTSYNNCIVQFTKKKKHRYVWMPIYGEDFSNEYLQVKKEIIKPADECKGDHKKTITEIPCGDWSNLKKYDDENERIWKSIGFNVEKLTNYLSFAEERGAVRCMSKVLYRTPYLETQGDTKNYL